MIVSLGAEGWGRLRAAIIRHAAAASDIGVATTEAADAMNRLGFRITGLTAIEIDPTESIAALDAAAKARASHTGCAGCLNYDNNPYLACAIHPLGRPGEVCGDWEVRPPKFRPDVQWAVEQLSYHPYHSQSYPRYSLTPTNSPEHEPGGCDRA
jgi:hypothetical protein